MTGTAKPGSMSALGTPFLSTRIVAKSEIFYNSPYNYIRSLLGSDIQDISYQVNDVILPNGSIAIDVKYHKIGSASLKTVYVNTSELTRLNPTTNEFIFTYEGEEIYIKISDQRDLKRTKLPVRIFPYTGKTNGIYRYIALLIASPLHAYTTVSYNSETSYNDAPPIIDVDQDVERRELFDLETTIENCKNQSGAFTIFERLNSVVELKSFRDIKQNASIGYVMDYKLLPDEGCRGHVIIHQERKSNILFYYPHASNWITPEHVRFIKDFMRYDHSNLPE